MDMRRNFFTARFLKKQLAYSLYLHENRAISRLRLTITIFLLLIVLLCDILQLQNHPHELRAINLGIVIVLGLFCLKIGYQDYGARYTQVQSSILLLLGVHTALAGLILSDELTGKGTAYFVSILLSVSIIPIVAGLNIFFTALCGMITLVSINVLFDYSTNAEAISSNIILAALIAISCLLIQILTLLSKRERLQALQQQRGSLKVGRKSYQLQIADNMKNKLLYIISHDMRGPIASIKGIMNLYNDNVISPDEFKSHTAKLANLLQQTSGMLDNLLYWSTLESERPLDFTACNIYELVQGILETMLHQTRWKGMALENQVAPKLVMRLDKPLIHLTFLNILSNAIKFTTAGCVAVRSSISSTKVYFEISDTGHGMAKEELAKLFDWERLSNSSGTHIDRGPGLGLLLCKEFVKKHNGEITVTSVKDLGTTVTISLPINLLITTAGDDEHPIPSKPNPVSLKEILI